MGPLRFLVAGKGRSKAPNSPVSAPASLPPQPPRRRSDIVLRHEPPFDPPRSVVSNPTQTDVEPVALEIVELCKEFPSGPRMIPVLQNLSLRVARGEFVALVGPANSGKSTFLQLVGGFERPSRGTIRVGDTLLHELDEEQLPSFRRRRMGFVFESSQLMPTLSAEENVAFPALLHGIPTGQVLGRATDLLEAVGLSAHRHHRPSQLSDSERQRVAIARAFIAHPEIVLADEPTGSLDPSDRRTVLPLLRRMAKTTGQTLIVVTQDPAVARLADRTFALEAAPGPLERTLPKAMAAVG